MGLAIYSIVSHATPEQMEGARSALGIIAAIAGVSIGCLALYFVPSIIAGARGHHQAGAIVALNLLLGWTFLGWVAAFVWSFTEVRKAGRV